jgi:hypothetical protein
MSLIEFTYNNSYHFITGMTFDEALYGKKCQTHVCWEEIGDRTLMGSKLVQIT